MNNIIVNYLPYLLSIGTIYVMLLAGNRNKYTWLVALLNQFFWLVWILNIKSWGLLPGHIALWIVYFRNYLKWRIIK